MNIKYKSDNHGLLRANVDYATKWGRSFVILENYNQDIDYSLMKEHQLVPRPFVSQDGQKSCIILKPDSRDYDLLEKMQTINLGNINIYYYDSSRNKCSKYNTESKKIEPLDDCVVLEQVK